MCTNSRGEGQKAVAWRDRLVSFRVLAFIILGLGVVRLIVAFLLPQEPSVMAPDEGTYAALAGVLGAGGDWAAWNSGWGAGLYPGSRALLGPAALLTYLGLPDLTAVRVVSVLYAVGAQLLLLSIARLARRRIALGGPYGLSLISWPMLGMAVFVLMPSNVLWSNLGLREAACAFWILGAVSCTAYLLTVRDWRPKALFGVGIAASITMTFQSRAYLAVALVIALAVGVVWLGRERPRFSTTLAMAIVAGTLLGVTLSHPASTGTAAQLSTEVLQQAEALKALSAAKRQEAERHRARAETLWEQAQVAELSLAALKTAGGDVKEARKLLRAQGAPSTALDLISQASAAANPAVEVQFRLDAAASLAASAGRTAAQESADSFALDLQADALLSQARLTAESPGTLWSLLQGTLWSLLQGAAQAPTAINPDTYLERGSYQRELSAQYANSAIATDSCAGVSTPSSLRWCEMTRLPGAALAVMFRPLWPLDIPAEWSTMAVMASLENIAWLALAVAALWGLGTRRFDFTRLLTISLAYGALVIAGMAVLEGNFGTAFRHKSSTLWVFCMVLLLTGASKAHRTSERASLSPTGVAD